MYGVILVNLSYQNNPNLIQYDSDANQNGHIYDEPLQFKFK